MLVKINGVYSKIILSPEIVKSFLDRFNYENATIKMQNLADWKVINIPCPLNEFCHKVGDVKSEEQCDILCDTECPLKPIANKSNSHGCQVLFEWLIGDKCPVTILGSKVTWLKMFDLEAKKSLKKLHTFFQTYQKGVLGNANSVKKR